MYLLFQINSVCFCKRHRKRWHVQFYTYTSHQQIQQEFPLRKSNQKAGEGLTTNFALKLMSFQVNNKVISCQKCVLCHKPKTLRTCKTFSISSHKQASMTLQLGHQWAFSLHSYSRGLSYCLLLFDVNQVITPLHLHITHHKSCYPQPRSW